MIEYVRTQIKGWQYSSAYWLQIFLSLGWRGGGRGRGGQCGRGGRGVGGGRDRDGPREDRRDDCREDRGDRGEHGPCPNYDLGEPRGSPTLRSRQDPLSILQFHRNPFQDKESKKLQITFPSRANSEYWSYFMFFF